MRTLNLEVGHSFNPARELVDALEDCNTQALGKVIQRLQRRGQAELSTIRLVTSRDYINAAVPGTRITALHVACMAYARSSDRNKAWVYNQAVAMLLDAGANPFLECLGTPERRWVHGKQQTVFRDGKTAIEICNGRLPPGLDEWIKAKCDDRLKHFIAA